jgi:hypothetical protein
MEFEGGLPREQAEHFALIEVVNQMRGDSRSAPMGVDGHPG